MDEPAAQIKASTKKPFQAFRVLMCGVKLDWFRRQLLTEKGQFNKKASTNTHRDTHRVLLPSLILIHDTVVPNWGWMQLFFFRKATL